ncbi:VCBS repeat-containing protein [Maribacter sp. LLG6340-A2]|uniref:VCBS repeat-containing protein n=1 Tax=Maribacter sp. LLG6340-A2 TaxID=3160834 RepID=UPI0038632DE8
MRVKNIIFFLALTIATVSCKKENIANETTPTFELLSNSKTNIHFTNKVTQTNNFNFLNYLDIFNGGGVALGDFNNDHLLDIYFTANEGKNALYINEGNFKFREIAALAGVLDQEGWSTGVNVIDINNDGFLDIYICKSASLNNPDLRKNKLYINQGDETFIDEAEKWGLAHTGFSIQSYFIDYDKDGDLDLYLVNHRSDFNNVRKVDFKDSVDYVEEFSDQLFRNDNGTFTNVTKLAGLQNKTWGLSAAIGDFNEDGWPDIYVANDFIQPDHLYINNKNGTFTDKVLELFDHISYNSMGSDYADLNNDLLPDLIVLDMLAEDHLRSKENMATMDTRGFEYMVDNGYHYPYMSNVLQLNQGKGNYSEVAQLMNISKTDWSWAPLIADFDNDGLKDIFVSNGIEKDLGNQDFRKNLRSTIQNNPQMNIQELEQLMPGEKLSNYMFHNKGDLEFINTGKEWGLDMPMNSNSAAYGDLDNDGDLDLVLNNSSDKAAVYKNNTNKNYLKLRLKGPSINIDAIGTQVKITTANGNQLKENYFTKGYQSATKDAIHFGLDTINKVDKIEIIWPDSTLSKLENISINETVEISHNSARPKSFEKVKAKYATYKTMSPKTIGIDFIHKETIYDDFKHQVLLPHKFSQLGPDLAIADVNNDGMDDILFSGAKNQANSLYLQRGNETFEHTVIQDFNVDSGTETIGLHFFDFDNDGDLDIYAANGSYEDQENSNLLQDAIYENDGSGNFKKVDILPNMPNVTKKVISIDYDLDGDLDLFVGGRLIPRKYPLPPTSYILQNNNGKFTDVTKSVAPEFENIGLVTDMHRTDFDNDGDTDLIVVGEWMPITLLENKNGVFKTLNIEALSSNKGWWQSIDVLDIDNDGDDDYLIGNLGKNNKFHPSISKPLHVYANYLDDNTTFDMVLSKEYKGKLVPTRGKECSTQQTPFIDTKIQSYEEFANSTLVDIYGSDKIEASYHSITTNLATSILINEGTNGYQLKSLPNSVQFGPTTDFSLMDINNDGRLDILGIGAIYEAEVETIRYDGNSGYILTNNKGTFKNNAEYLNLKSNSRKLQQITIGKNKYLIVVNNNSEPTLIKL